MQRAAAGLAAVVAASCAPGARVYGARVVLLVGSRDNGGTRCGPAPGWRGRGARVDAVLLGRPGARRRGWPRCAGAGGRVHRGGRRARATCSAAPTSSSTASSGSAARPGLDDAAPRPCWPGWPPDACVVAVDLPSGVDPDTGEVGDGARPRPTSRSRSACSSRRCCCRRPSSYAGRVELVDIGLGRPGRPDGRSVAALDVADARRGLAVAVARRRQVPPWRPRRRRRRPAYTGAAVLCVGAAVRSGAGMVRYLGPGRADRRWCVPAGPRSCPGAGPRAGLGGRPGARTRTAATARPAGRGRAGRGPAVPGRRRRAGPAHRSAGSRRPAHPARRRAGPAADPAGRRETERADVEADRGRSTPAAPPQLTGATVLLKGATTLVVPPDGGTVLAQRGGPSWLATAGSGDVLAGVAGTLLAAGLEPMRAGAWPRPCTAGPGSRPAVAAGDGGTVLDAVPRAIAALRDRPV